MSFGNFWNNAEEMESKLHACIDSAAIHADFTAMIVRMLTEQQTIIEQQSLEIEQLKRLIQKLKVI